MIDMPDRPNTPREPCLCIYCGKPIHDGDWYIYCSTECRDADVPNEPGRGGVCS